MTRNDPQLNFTQERQGSVTRRLCVAPMLDWTDTHFRGFLRLITRRTFLYTEMVTTDALLHGDPERLLAFDPIEHPLALQLGGSDPDHLARCSILGAELGYDEINMNVGCPSERVRAGRFGACLMTDPERVADCVAAMKAAVGIPITVKTRIGVDHRDSYEELLSFAGKLGDAGCDALIVHARKAWLAGLSPKENRDIPPLRYDMVERLKSDLPHQTIIINGGIKTLTEAQHFLQRLDGVMIGREAYHNPWILASADRVIFDEPAPTRTRQEVIADFTHYIDRQLAAGVRFTAISRHLMGLFQGQPGARIWRRYLSEHGHRSGADSAILGAALLALRARCPEPDTHQIA